MSIHRAFTSLAVYVLCAQALNAQTVVVNESTDKEKFVETLERLQERKEFARISEYTRDYAAKNPGALFRFGNNLYLSPWELMSRVLDRESFENVAKAIRPSYSAQIEEVFKSFGAVNYHLLDMFAGTAEGNALRILLARQLIEGGRLDEALNILTPLITDEKAHSDSAVRRLLLSMLRRADDHYYAVFAGHVAGRHNEVAADSGDLPAASGDQMLLKPAEMKFKELQTERFPPVTYGAWGFNYGDWDRQQAPISSKYEAIAARGLIILNRETQLIAYLPFNGGLREIWRYKTVASTRDYEQEHRLLLSAVYHDCDGGSLFAPLVTSVSPGVIDEEFIQTIYPFARRALFRFDLLSGDVAWKIGGGYQKASFEDNLNFNSTPVFHNGMLVTTAIYQSKSQDPFTHYLVFIDPATGKLLKKVFIASGTTQINLFGNSISESLTGRVAVTPHGYFCTTNLGVVAMVGFGGELKWVSKYPKIPVSPSRTISPQKSPPSWFESAPVYYYGVIVFTPLDSERLVVMDAATGDIRYTIPRRWSRYFYGPVRGRIITSGDGVRAYDVFSGDILEELSIGCYGRGAVYRGHLFVPLENSIGIIDLESLTLVRQIELSGMQYSNISFDGNFLLAASNDSLSCFYSPKAAPGGDDEVVGKIVEGDLEGILKTGDISSRGEGTGAFLGDLLTLHIAEKYVSEGRLKEAGSLLDRLFCEPITHGKVRRKALDLRLSIAAASGDPASAAGILTSLLKLTKSDARLWQSYRAKLWRLLNENGSSCYEAQELKAKELLESISQCKNDPARYREGLVEMYRIYPFASCSVKALVEYARVVLEDKRYAEALNSMLFVRDLLRKRWSLRDIEILAAALKSLDMEDELSQLMVIVGRTSPEDREERELKDRLMSDYAPRGGPRVPLAVRSISVRHGDICVASVDAARADSDLLLVASQTGGAGAVDVNTVVYDVRTLEPITTLNFAACAYYRWQDRLAVIGSEELRVYSVRGRVVEELARNHVPSDLSYVIGIGGKLVMILKDRPTGRIEFTAYDVASNSLAMRESIDAVQSVSLAGAVAYNSMTVAFHNGSSVFLYRPLSNEFFTTSFVGESEIQKLALPSLSDSRVLVSTKSTVACYDVCNGFVPWRLELSAGFIAGYLDYAWVVTSGAVYKVDLVTGKRLERHVISVGSPDRVIAGPLGLIVIDDRHDIYSETDTGTLARTGRLPADYADSFVYGFDRHILCETRTGKRSLVMLDVKGNVINRFFSGKQPASWVVYRSRRRVTASVLYDNQLIEIYD